MSVDTMELTLDDLLDLLYPECPEDCEDGCCVEEDTRIELSESEADEAFQDFVNEINPVITICGLDYEPARALKQIDPTAYHEGFLNWMDMQSQEGINSFPWNE